MYMPLMQSRIAGQLHFESAIFPITLLLHSDHCSDRVRHNPNRDMREESHPAVFRLPAAFVPHANYFRLRERYGRASQVSANEVANLSLGCSLAE